MIQKNSNHENWNHTDALNQLLKVIQVTPMDCELKMVLRMRVWGKNPHIFAPMDREEIAMDLGCKIDEVERMEVFAVENVEKFLGDTPIQEAINKFNRDLKQNKSEIALGKDRPTIGTSLPKKKK